MQQSLIVGVGTFGAEVVARVRALPHGKNVVDHRLDCPPDKPVAAAYVDYRKRMLDVLNKEVYNFANTPLTVYLVGLLVERHMADNLMHLGYLFKSFFRENIILNPRIKVLSALPTILPEEAYEWLPATRKTLERLDGYAALREPFTPAYDGLKRKLPALSGPPFEEVCFCYSESLDADDVEVTAQAAATRIYFDLALLPGRAAAEPQVAQFYRNTPAGQPFLPISGCAVAFFPAFSRLVRDEMEYVLLLRLAERFLPQQGPDAVAVEKRGEELLRKAHLLRLPDLVQAIVEHALTQERWFDLAAIDLAGRYDIEMSPPPEAYLTGALANLEREKNRFAGRLRDLALETVLSLPARLLDEIRGGDAALNLAEADALFTRAFASLTRLLEQLEGHARQAREDWEKALAAAKAKGPGLKELLAKDARPRRGSPAEAQILAALKAVEPAKLLRAGLTASVVESLAREEGLLARLREAYDRIHESFAGFLGRRNELLTHLVSRRDGYLRRRELHLYVFNQAFREKLLDAQIQKAIEEETPAAKAEGLDRVLKDFFFKRWWAEPKLPLETVEQELMEEVRLSARPWVERAAARIQVDYKVVLRILEEIALAQVSSIFDAKYKEHPQAAYREILFLCHKEEALAESLPARPPAGQALADVALAPDLPFQVLQVMEIHNLPFRALRQYASLDREEAAGPAAG